TEIPTIASPCDWYFLWRSTKPGISTLQGPHHVAQKFSTITLPANELSATSLPFVSFRVKFRSAGFRFGAPSAGPEAAAAVLKAVAMVSRAKIDRFISGGSGA